MFGEEYDMNSTIAGIQRTLVVGGCQLRSAKTFMGDKKRLVKKQPFDKAVSVKTSFCKRCGSVCLSCDNCKDAILPDEDFVCLGSYSLGKSNHYCKKCYESSVGGDKNG